MKAPLRKSLYIFFLLVLLADANLSAQWKNIAPDLFSYFDTLTGHTQTQGGRGAMCFTNGVIWVGVNRLFSSTDSGKSWQRNAFPVLGSTLIRDIYFLDRWNGLVATSDEGVLLTRDGGKSWKTILSTNGDFWKAAFNGSTEIIHALGVDKGVYYTSFNGGTSWSQSYIGPYVSCLAISPDHTVYVFAQEKYKSSTQGWISYSTDLGISWIKSAGLSDGDCYTLSADSCDPNKLYLLNEDWASTNNWLSEFFVTSDRGNTWQSFNKQPVPYFTGPLATTNMAMYAGTVADDGIVRSTDKGVTWKSIGGPPTEGDSRSVIALNDNIVFVLDTRGNVWATFNSGGDSLNSISPDAAFRFSSARIINDSLNITIRLPIYLHHSGNTEYGAEMIMHYPTISLKYLSAVLYNGKVFDVAGSQWPGRVKLQIMAADLNAASDSVLGYINFLWSPLEYSCNYISFDSVEVIDPCSQSSTKNFLGIIGSLPSCILSSVSDKRPVDIAPIFSFSPNPAGDFGTLSSEKFSGPVLIKLYDMTGRLITAFEGSISGEPLKISLRDLASGVYHLSIHGNGKEYQLPFVHR